MAVLELMRTTEFTAIWDDASSGASKDGSFYQPIVDEGFHALGHLAVSGYDDPNGRAEMVVVKDTSPNGNALKSPVDYKLVWKDEGSGAHERGSLWQPLPPSGYVAMGCVAQLDYAKPALDLIRCVRTDLVTPAAVGEVIWTDQGSGAATDTSVWAIDSPSTEPGIGNAGTVSPGAFVATDSYSKPTSHPCVYVLQLVSESVLTPSGHRFKPLPTPARGHAGQMQQPQWVDSEGYFVFGNESIIYAMTESGFFVWSIEPKLIISGYTIVANDLYIQDGHVLCKYDMPLIDEGSFTAPDGCDACVNHITGARFETKDEAVKAEDAYRLPPEETENLAQLQAAWKRQAWANLRAQAEAAQTNLAQNQTIDRGDASAVAEGLARMIDNIGHLVGDATDDDQALVQAEANAAKLRFTAPTIKRTLSGDDDTSIYTLAADGTIAAYTGGLEFVGTSRQNPPDRLALVLRQDQDKTTLQYSSQGAIITLTADPADGSVLQQSDSVTPPNGAAKWMAAALATERAQPSAQTLLADGQTQVYVTVAHSEAAQTILFVLVDDRSHRSSLRVLHPGSSLPHFNNGTLSIAPPSPMPAMTGGQLCIGDKVTKPIRVIAAPVSKSGDAAGYAYVVADVLPGDLARLKALHISDAEWAQIQQDGQAKQPDNTHPIDVFPLPELHLTSLQFLRYRPANPITTDNWQAVWASCMNIVDATGQAAINARQAEANTRNEVIKFVLGLHIYLGGTLNGIGPEAYYLGGSWRPAFNEGTANRWADRAVLDAGSARIPLDERTGQDALPTNERSRNAFYLLRHAAWSQLDESRKLGWDEGDEGWEDGVLDFKWEDVITQASRLAVSSSNRDEVEREEIAKVRKDMLDTAVSKSRVWNAWREVESAFWSDDS